MLGTMCMHALLRCTARCDNRDKLDDNAIPISEVGQRGEERERSFIKKGSLKRRELRSRKEDVCERMRLDAVERVVISQQPFFFSCL